MIIMSKVNTSTKPVRMWGKDIAGKLEARAALNKNYSLLTITLNKRKVLKMASTPTKTP